MHVVRSADILKIVQEIALAVPIRIRWVVEQDAVLRRGRSALPWLPSARRWCDELLGKHRREQPMGCHAAIADRWIYHFATSAHTTPCRVWHGAAGSMKIRPQEVLPRQHMRREVQQWMGRTSASSAAGMVGLSVSFSASFSKWVPAKLVPYWCATGPFLHAEQQG